MICAAKLYQLCLVPAVIDVTASEAKQSRLFKDLRLPRPKGLAMTRRGYKIIRILGMLSAIIKYDWHYSALSLTDHSNSISHDAWTDERRPYKLSSVLGVVHNKAADYGSKGGFR